MPRRNETGNGRFEIAGAGSVNCMRSVVFGRGVIRSPRSLARALKGAEERYA